MQSQTSHLLTEIVKTNHEVSFYVFSFYEYIKFYMQKVFEKDQGSAGTMHKGLLAVFIVTGKSVKDLVVLRVEKSV